MTLFSSLGARRLALLAVVFVLGVACAKVERDYDDSPTAGSDSGGSGSGGHSSGGTAGSAKTGGSGGNGEEAGSAGSVEAGSGGEAGAMAGAGGASPTTLTVTLAGDGKGVVTSDVGGVDCGTNCSVGFDPDTTVVLTAKPDANSTFAGWAGACSGTGTCKVVISDATEVKATFTSIKVSLSVALAGNGSGSVTSVPPGINCGTACSMQVPQGGSVKLIATAAVGSAFAGWSGGGCTGTSDCTTTVNAAAAVVATFTTTPQLTVVKAGNGIGTVTSAPAGINCGTECAQNINYGNMVTLTATTTAGTSFVGWSGGGCTGTGTCVVTVTAATQVTATFSCSANTLTLNYTGAMTSFTVPACVTSLTIDAYGASGGNANNGTTTYTGGAGARMKGTFVVTGGTVLKVLVGGAGKDAIDVAQQEAGSGGGGTFVTNSANSPFVVAGGGGGAGLATPASNGVGGVITKDATAGSGGAELGGVNGAGGVSSTWTGWHGGSGGGGLTGNGVNLTSGNSASYGSPNAPGMAFINGGAGGVAGNCGSPAISGCTPGARNGGFGGGGAAGFTGGGGGGYSGGGAGQGSFSSATSGGGGGGSYNGGTNQTNTAATRIGNGMVVFTY